jgi:hypothetical protein
VALFVLHAVAGEVEQEEIVTLPLIVEPGDGPADRCTVLVQEGGHLVETSDVGRLEHALERVHIDIRSLQAAQTVVVVAAVADDQGELAGHSVADG